MASYLSWNDVLFPGQHDTTIYVRRIMMERPKKGLQGSQTTFVPPESRLDNLPSKIHLVENLGFRMSESLRAIINHNYLGRATQTEFANLTVTPATAFQDFQTHCALLDFHATKESDVESIAERLGDLVIQIFSALTGETLVVDRQEPTSDNEVRTNMVYKIEDDREIKIMWEDKSPLAFNTSMRKLEREFGACEPGVGLQPYGLVSSRYGFKAMFAKFSYHARMVQPRARWAVLFSGLKYIVVYIPRSQEQATLFVSRIMDIDVREGTPPGTAEPGSPTSTAEPDPPIWSILIFMLLCELRGTNDDLLRQRLDIPVPGQASSTGTKVVKRSERLRLRTTGDSGQGPSNLGTLL